MSNAIATNAAANSAVSFLSRNSEWQSSSIAKLSSGSRIVKASDDAASLAVGTKLKADVTALKQASTNADQAASLMQVADGALSRVSDTLMRMKSLATQARSDALTDTERGYLNQEFGEMQSQIDFISSSTKFNDTAVISGALGATTTAATTVNAGGSNVEGRGSIEGEYRVNYDSGTGALSVEQYNLGDTPGTDTPIGSQTAYIDNTDTAFEGTVKLGSVGFEMEFTGFDANTVDITDEDVTVNGNDAIFQVGVTAGSGNDDIEVSIGETTTATLGVDGDNINTIAAAETASNNLDTAIEAVNQSRASLGANMSRMEKINDNLATTTENLDAARSTLMDVDVAAEMTEFSKNQVMTQASTAMLAQANQLPQNLMRLLQ